MGTQVKLAEERADDDEKRWQNACLWADTVLQKLASNETDIRDFALANLKALIDDEPAALIAALHSAASTSKREDRLYYTKLLAATVERLQSAGPEASEVLQLVGSSFGMESEEGRKNLRFAIDRLLVVLRQSGLTFLSETERKSLRRLFDTKLPAQIGMESVKDQTSPAGSILSVQSQRYLLREVQSIFGDDEEWLRTPNEYLGGFPPRELIGTDREHLVVELVEGIKHGVTT
jgi:hypothetical protein